MSKIIQNLFLQWRQMWFTKDSERKHETAEGCCAETAETALPKKQSKSARDRGRVHGLTSSKDLMCSNNTWRVLPKRRYFYCQCDCWKCAGNWRKIYDVWPPQREGGIWILTKYCRSWKPSQALSSLRTHPQSLFKKITFYNKNAYLSPPPISTRNSPG